MFHTYQIMHPDLTPLSASVSVAPQPAAAAAEVQRPAAAAAEVQRPAAAAAATKAASDPYGHIGEVMTSNAQPDEDGT